MTQIYIKQNIRKHQTQNFRRISPFRITPVEKHIRLGHAGIVDHSVDLSIPDFKKVLKKNVYTHDTIARLKQNTISTQQAPSVLVASAWFVMQFVTSQ